MADIKKYKAKKTFSIHINNIKILIFDGMLVYIEQATFLGDYYVYNIAGVNIGKLVCPSDEYFNEILEENE